VTLRVVVVDDEQLPRQRVADLVRAHPALELIGQAEHGAAALDVIVERRPDLVFLDIQMPELDGFRSSRRSTMTCCPRSCSSQRSTSTRSGP
jgi:two-component system LytT family response regulator